MYVWLEVGVVEETMFILFAVLSIEVLVFSVEAVEG